MKRVLKIGLWAIVILLVAVIVLLNVAGGTVIRNAVNVAGPLAMGVPVTLQDADLHLLRGNVRLEGLHVGNPEGFKTAGIFDLGRLDIDLDMRSLLGDTIRIRTIHIKDPNITYERGLTDSNLGALLRQLEGEKSKEKSEPDSAPKEGGKKVVIDEIQIAGAQLNVSVTLAGGYSAPMPLPTITLRDVGKEKEGASLTEVITSIVGAIAGTVTDVLVGAGKLVGKGAQAVGEGAMAVGEGAVKGAEVVGGAVVDGASAVGGAAVDGAKAVGSGAAAVGGAAVGGAKAVGGAVAGGASKVASGIGSLFGGEKETNEAEKADAPPAE